MVSRSVTTRAQPFGGRLAAHPPRIIHHTTMEKAQGKVASARQRLDGAPSGRPAWRNRWTRRGGGILADHHFSPPQRQRATRDRSSRKMHVGIEIARFWGRFVSWNAMGVNRKDPSLTLLYLRLLPRAKALAPPWSHFTTTCQRGRGRGRADYVPGFGGGGAAGFRLKSKQSDMSSALASL
jgi:hypothetical protein